MFLFQVKTIIISIISLAIIVFIQGYVANSNLRGVSPLLSSYYSVGILPLSALILTNFVVDFTSNTITISVLRMVASTDSELDFVVGFLADMALTITSFMIIFPVGIVIASLVIEYQTQAARIDIDPQGAIAEMPAWKNKNLRLVSFIVTNPTNIYADPTAPQILIFTFVEPSSATNNSQRIHNIISLMDANLERQTNKTERERERENKEIKQKQKKTKQTKERERERERDKTILSC